jgi:hypothetical protein
MFRFSFHLRPSMLTICVAGIATLFSTTSTPVLGQTGVINPLNYPGSDLCQQIKMAIMDNAAANRQGLVIDARSASGIKQCSVNPLEGATVPGQLLLGATVLQIAAPIVTPSLNAWQIIGIGRGNNVNQTATIIEALPGFPPNAKLVRLGDGTHLTFGNRIENLTINCNNIAGTVGLYSTDIQEQSGGSNLAIVSCPARELWINGSGSDGTGPQFAMNYEFHDVEALALKAGIATTIACEFDGNTTSQPSGPHLLSGITCSGMTGYPIATGFVFDSFSSSDISNLGAEFAATGYLIGNAAPLNSVTFNGLSAGAITGSVVHVKNPPMPANHNVMTDIELSNVVDDSGTAPALIIDDILGKTLNSQRTLGTYRIGNPGPSFGTFVPGYTHVTDSPFFGSQLPSLNLNNASDASPGNLLKISSGLSSTAPAMVELDDRGTARWQIGKDDTENFELFDSIANVMRLQAVPNSNMEVNAAAGGTLYLNLFAGSGGVSFCNGASSCPAFVSSGGTGSFRAVAIPSLGASTHALCTTTGGVITNVGCTALAAAPSGLQGAQAPIVTGRRAAPRDPMDDPAPLNSPSFTGTPSLPSVAGVGFASFLLGKPELVGGADAIVMCAAEHVCDSFSGTLQLSTGPEPIAESRSQMLRILLPVVRQNLPNCIVTVSTAGNSRLLPISIQFAGSSSLAVISTSPLTPSTTYDITYLCGGN